MNHNYLIITLLSFLGVLASLKIFLDNNKKVTKHLLCLPGQNCDLLFDNSYSRFFNIRVEFLGLIYFGILLGIFGFHLITGEILSHIFQLVTLMVISAASIFSLYLTLLQIFSIRKFCTLCIIGALTSIFIFLVAWDSITYNFVPWLNEIRRFLIAIHVLGVVLGLGGVTMADTFLFRFLKDQKLTKKESEVLEYLTEIIWFGLGIVYLSGIAIFLTDVEKFTNSPKFITKAVALLILTINGFFLNHVVSPKLMKIMKPGKTSKDYTKQELKRYRYLAFGLGAVSLTSWYTAFILGMMRTSPASLRVMLAAYFSLVITAVIMSNFTARCYFDDFKSNFGKKIRKVIVGRMKFHEKINESKSLHRKK